MSVKIEYLYVAAVAVEISHIDMVQGEFQLPLWRVKPDSTKGFMFK